MIVTKCDRCGKVYHLKPLVDGKEFRDAPRRMWKYGMSEVDLCRDCLKDWGELMYRWWSVEGVE